MQNSEWFKRFSFFLILVLIFIFIYGSLNFLIMNLEKEKKEKEKNLNTLKEEYLDLLIEYEIVTNPKNMIERAVNVLKLKYSNVEVIEIDTGNNNN